MWWKIIGYPPTKGYGLVLLGNKGGGRDMERGLNLVLEGSHPITITAFTIFKLTIIV